MDNERGEMMPDKCEVCGHKMSKTKQLGQALYDIIEWLDDCSWYGGDSRLIAKSVESLAAVGFDVERFRANMAKGIESLDESGYNVSDFDDYA